jgi:hypothetical protein
MPLINYSQSVDSVPNIPELQKVIETITNVTIEYSSLVYEVQSKLHCILSMPQPEEKNKNENKNNSSDFVTSVYSIISQVENNNIKLRNALNHLTQIVG